MARHDGRHPPRRVSLLAQVLALVGLILLAAMFLNALQPGADRRVNLTRFLAGSSAVLFAISMAYFGLRQRRQEGWGKRFRRGCRRLVVVGVASAAGLVALEFTLRHHLHWAPEPAPAEPARAGFQELDRIRRWNQTYVATRPSQFAGWPIPVEQFEHDSPAPRYIFKPNQRMALRDGVLTPAQPGETVVRATNSWGFRGPDFPLFKPPGTLRIVCLGDGGIEGGLDEDGTCPVALQRELATRHPGCPLEVLNAGHEGQTLDDLQEVLRYRVLPLNPDVVVLYAGPQDNDLGEYVVQTAQAPPAVRRSVLLSIVSERLELRDQPRYDPTASAPSRLRFRQGLTEMARLCARRGVRLVFSSYVTLPQPGTTPAPYKPEDLVGIYAQINASIAEAAQVHGLTYIDAAASFPRDTRYFPSDPTHLNSEGNAILGRLLAEGLLKEVLQRQGNTLLVRPARP